MRTRVKYAIALALFVFVARPDAAVRAEGPGPTQQGQIQIGKDAISEAFAQVRDFINSPAGQASLRTALIGSQGDLNLPIPSPILQAASRSWRVQDAPYTFNRHDDVLVLHSPASAMAISVQIGKISLLPLPPGVDRTHQQIEVSFNSIRFSTNDITLGLQGSSIPDGFYALPLLEGAKPVHIPASIDVTGTKLTINLEFSSSPVSTPGQSIHIRSLQVVPGQVALQLPRGELNFEFKSAEGQPPTRITLDSAGVAKMESTYAPALASKLSATLRGALESDSHDSDDPNAKLLHDSFVQPMIEQANAQLQHAIDDDYVVLIRLPTPHHAHDRELRLFDVINHHGAIYRAKSENELMDVQARYEELMPDLQGELDQFLTSANELAHRPPSVRRGAKVNSPDPCTTSARVREKLMVAYALQKTTLDWNSHNPDSVTEAQLYNDLFSDRQNACEAAQILKGRLKLAQSRADSEFLDENAGRIREISEVNQEIDSVPVVLKTAPGTDLKDSFLNVTAFIRGYPNTLLSPTDCWQVPRPQNNNTWGAASIDSMNGFFEGLYAYDHDIFNANLPPEVEFARAPRLEPAPGPHKRGDPLQVRLIIELKVPHTRLFGFRESTTVPLVVNLAISPNAAQDGLHIRSAGKIESPIPLLDTGRIFNVVDMLLTAGFAPIKSLVVHSVLAGDQGKFDWNVPLLKLSLHTKITDIRLDPSGQVVQVETKTDPER